MENGFPQVAWEGTQAFRSADSNLRLRVGLDPEGLSVEAGGKGGQDIGLYLQRWMGDGKALPHPTVLIT